MIAVLDLIFVVFSFISLSLVLFAKKNNASLRDIRFQLVAVFVLHGIYSILLLIQWTNLSHAFEQMEDLAGVLIPFSWLFLIHGFIHKIDKSKIRKSEERLALALTGAKCGIWDWNLKTGAVFFDQNYYTLSGYEPDEFPHSIESWKKRVHPEDIRRVEKKVASYLNKDVEPFVAEFRFKTKSGQWMWIQGRGFVAQWDEDGTPKRFTGIHIDITDRKEAEEKTKASEEFLNSVFDNIPNMIFVKDAKSLRFLRINRMGESLLGYSNQELCGKSDHDFFPGPQADFFTEKDRHALSTGEPFMIPEERIQTKNLGERVLRTKKIAIRDKAGTPKYLLGISEDITEFKKMESKLRQAQKMEAIGTLAGGIAHDFNNILSPLIGYAEILKEDMPEDSPFQVFVAEIFKSAFRAKDLVGQILTFSRRTDQKFVPVRFQSIVKEALKLLKASIPATIEIETDIEPGGCRVMADPTQLHQIILNLATNSYHAMQTAGGKLKIVLKPVSIVSDVVRFPGLSPGEYAVLKVIDTGKGIPKEMMEKIFDPYFTTKKAGEGTGLGLSVVDGIVKRHGGDIHVYSEVDKGTEVHVYIPVAKDGPDNGKLETSGVMPRGSEHILLVDDEKAIASVEKEMLERLGYRVTSLNKGADALRTFIKHPDDFDLIVTDMTMPGMTGLELIKEIRRIRPHMPAVICTGFSEQVNLKTSRDFGIQGYLAKPVVKNRLAQTLRDILDQGLKG